MRSAAFELCGSLFVCFFVFHLDGFIFRELSVVFDTRTLEGNIVGHCSQRTKLEQCKDHKWLYLLNSKL